VAAATVLLATGASGLIYEVAWQRYLAIVVGSDHAATATTLAVFLGGLSLGYAWCGGLSARASRPLAVYVGLELAIGAWGLAFPWIFAGVEGLARAWSFSRPFGLIAGSLAAAAPLVLPPALLMGATVPLMTQGLAVSRSRLTATHARVYGLNTLGAVVGALAGGFGLLPSIGLGPTVRLAAALNLVAALILLRLSARGAGGTAAAAAIEGGAAPPPGPAWRLSALALLAGVATMAQENALIRLASLTLGGTPFVFSLVVAAFVAAIAVGSLVVARRPAVAPGALSAACAASSAAWLALFWTYDTWPWLAHVLRFWPVEGGLGWGAYHAAVWLLLTSALFPAVAPMGAVLPLAFHERRASVAGAGRASGRLLAWNALGSLLGSLAGGILLFELLDLARVLLVAPLVAAAMAWLAAPRGRRAPRLLAAGLAAGALATGAWRPGFDPQRLALGTYRMRAVTPVSFAGPRKFHAGRMVNRHLIYQQDGPLDSVAVLEVPAWDLPRPRPLEIYIDGKSESNTLYDRETLRLAAHLPMLMAGDGRRVLVVGQGTGVTAGELTLWPELERLDLVELSPTVAGTLPLFRAQTRDVGADPRLRLHVADARFFLRRPGPGWDVIVSEPSNVWVGSNDLLFTLEFFRSAAARLSADGVLLQWMHLYETNPRTLCSIVATLGAVLPDLTAFRGTQGDWLIVASRGLGADVAARVRRRLDDHADVRASLAELNLGDVDSLWARRIGPFASYAERARRQCPPHTALDTGLGYRAAQDLFTGTVLFEHEVLGVGAAGLPGSDAPSRTP